MNTYANRFLTIEERFFRFIHFEPMSGCWLWVGAATAHGYGSFRPAYPGGMVPAHRFSYELHKGEIPYGFSVMHTCDNPACCNPEHLVAGTHQQNIAHRDAVGRQARGAKIHTNKLSVEDVIEIRSMGINHVPHRVIAARFGIDKSHVSRLISNKYWKYVEQPEDLAGFQQGCYELRTILKEAM